MAIIKCKMCGGDLILTEGQSVAECDSCGRLQTIPNLDDEKKLIQFERAERLRRQCEFDKAAGIYETIVADFRQEAEAYWGLVLCKFGIEYVDDPATGKKIPTCHRSSFDSIMDDSDFEQALENADGTARKIYREEAKVIEEIRKGIIAVSNNEKPYDIFICYKETAENGERTLDSVLAQDVYDALTDKGYRVFFSRITLEDKLGMEYEPYIFAALHSAKIMLAFGTDYEYFNAVWVKNEWSRFLKLMAKDKDKHLIPCYKGIDAYDMPKEFARLQAQDLGKVGAIQDLLRGIEKIIPRQTAQPAVVQERVLVGGSGDNKIASLLDRGNMALEDGDWAKADSFFEDVLNNDSKNAQAYLGKTLATEKCRTIDAFARKRKDASQNVRGETLKLPPNQAHVDEMAKQFSLPGYVEQSEICKLYDFDLSYHSDVAERRQQYRNEEKFWVDHKWLSKAEKFAVGAVAEHLETEKKALFAALADRVKKAEAAEAIEKQNVQARYEAHLRQVDELAEKLYNEGLARREKYYKELLQIAKTSSDVAELTETATKFEKLGSYQDSKNLAEHCRKRVIEEQAKLDAEAEHQRILREKQARERKAKRKRNAILLFAAVGTILVVVAVFLVVLNAVIIPNGKYNDALALMDAGKYVEAIVVFEELDGYKDSTGKIAACRELLQKQEMEILDAKYNNAMALVNNGKYTEAAIAFGAIADYRDARTQSFALWDKVAIRDTISAGDLHTVGLKSNGTVVAVGENYDGQCNVSGWKDIVAISAGGRHTVGLKADGTVMAVGGALSGKCEVSSWKDIVAIAAGSSHTVGLKADGTVVVVGSNNDGECEVSGWKDIVAIAAGSDHTVGLKSDGTVVATGNNNHGQREVSSWRDVVAVSAGNSHTVGLKADGTVVATKYTGSPNSNYGYCEVSGWRDIVAVSAGSWHTVGLKADGTVVATKYTGYLYNGQCEVFNWRDVVVVAAGGGHTVGLKMDGTVVATEYTGASYTNHGQCEVLDWKDINVPEK